MQEDRSRANRWFATHINKWIPLLLFLATAALAAVPLGWAQIDSDQLDNQLALAPISRSAAFLPQWTASNCGNCHKPDRGFSHPVGVIPTMATPKHLPLENGRITCATCHDNTDPAQHALARQTHSKLLRSSGSQLNFASICSQCHNRANLSRRDMHSLATGKAHLRWAGENSRRTSNRNTQMDNSSDKCLACHDGSVAPDVEQSASFSLSGKGGRGGRGARGGGSHPVGVSYKNARSRRSGRRGRTNMMLTPIASLDKRIRLFENNNIECSSCHSLFSQNKNLLVMSNYRSKLCLSCHDM